MRNITNSNCPSACYGSYGKIVKGLLLSMAIVLFNLTYVNAQNASTQSNSQTTVIVNGQTMDVVDLEDYIPTTAGKGLVAKNLPPSAPNPGLAENMSCSNLRVAFILDESRSIITRNGVDQVKEAALGLAEAFQGSPAFLSIIEFDEQARVIDLGTNNVSGTFISNLESYLYDEDGYNDQTYAPAPVAGSGCLQGYTNWEDALLSIDADINLVIFVTDGDPTAYNADNSCGYVLGGGDEFLAPAILAANTIKGNGTHMFAIGVGDHIFEANLQAVSGPSNFALGGDIWNTDYLIGSFADLKDNLTAGLNAICGTELDIDKSADLDQVCSDETVTFTLTVTNTGGDHGYDAAEIVVTDTFPSQFTDLAIVGAVSGASLNGQILTYEIAELASGESATIQVTANLGTAADGVYTNTAHANAVNANKVQDDASVEKTDVITTNDEVTACESYDWNGQTYTESGTYTFEGQNENGCPTHETLVLTIDEPISSEITASACGSWTWDRTGDVFSESVVDSVYVFPGVDGACDETVTLNISIVPAGEVEALCAAWPYDSEWGVTYYEAGIYYIQFSEENCAVLHLTFQVGEPCYLLGEEGGEPTGVVNENCECEEIPEEEFDCEDLQLNYGDSCDDGNAGTENDTINDECECVGTPVYDCPQLQANIGDECNDGNDYTENDVIGENCVCAGTPIIVFTCPELQANIGDPCDDGNALTEGDILNENCECEGIPVEVDCPELSANIGDSCDDGNSNTFGDVVTEDCECVGTPQQVGEDCTDFSTYFISHGPGISGSDIYKVNFVGSDAVLTFAFNVDYSAHMAIDAQSGIAYLINENGASMEAFDLSGYSSIGTISLADGMSHVVAAVFNPADGLVYIGDQIAKKVYTVDPNGAGELVFFANAPVSGGDLAFQNGVLHLATKTGNRLYRVIENADPELVGGLPRDANGLAASNNNTDVIVSNLNSSVITQIDVTDGSTQATYNVTLNGEIYTIKNGDLASGCGDNDTEIIVDCYGSEIIEFNQGLSTSGNAIGADRSDETKALGEPDRSNAAGGFVSLGVGGSITIAFGGQVIDGPGNDIKIWETSFAGNNCGGPGDERADIELSADGITFIYAGTICLDGEVDMASVGLDYVTQIRITNAATTNTPDGYDVDGVEALHGCGSNPSIEYGDCYATEAVEYVQGTRLNGGVLPIERTDTNKALGAPQRNNTMNFLSLGYGGSVVLGFDGAVPNGPGDDIEIVETTYNFVSVGAYPEYADVYVSVDGINWIFAKNVTHSDRFIDLDVVGLDYITYVKIVNDDVHSSTDDGFDVDGVVALHNCIEVVAPRAEVATPTSQLASYPNPTTGSSKVVFTTGTTSQTVVEVYDMSGRNIGNLFNREAQAGITYILDFNGNNLPNGVYIYKLTTNNETIIEKFMIAK